MLAIYSGSEEELAAVDESADVFAFFRPPRAGRLRAAGFDGSVVDGSATSAVFFFAADFLPAPPRFLPRDGFSALGVSSATADGAGLSIVAVGVSGSAPAAGFCDPARVPTTPTFRICAGGAPPLPIGPRPPRADMPLGAEAAGFSGAGAFAFSADASCADTVGAPATAATS